MNFKLTILLLLLLTCIAVGQTKYQKDFKEFWTNIHDNYAYLNQQNIDWEKVKQIYQPQADQITTDKEFIRLLENVLNELHNGHISLNINLESSNRLVPSGLDMYVENMNGKFIVTDLRDHFGAKECGLKTGMEIVKFNQKPVEQQLQKFLPKYTESYDSSMIQFALDMLFAGTHDTKRSITTLEDGKEHIYYPDNVLVDRPKKLLEFKKVHSTTGIIKINNSLGDYQLISEFDKVLDSLFSAENLIIDLTETPGGGNSTVARAIMGRFIDEKMPYQQHEIDEAPYETKRYWIEYVLPRKTIYQGKLYILVGHWTGSMGEGMVIGFDAMNRATTIGTRMAGLIGSIEGFELKQTKIRYQIPTERLYHINGTPREKYLPRVLTKNTEETYQAIDRIK